MRHFCLGVEEDLSRESERSCSEVVRLGSATPDPSVGARRSRRAAMVRGETWKVEELFRIYVRVGPEVNAQQRRRALFSAGVDGGCPAR